MKKNFCRLGHFRLGLGFALLVSGMAFGQMRSISGSVMDRDRPLSGVTVRQKGTELIAVTDKEGRFQIEVNGSDAVLEFEHPDYEQVSERIGQENRIKVLLSKAVNKIEEVLINAGYYTVKDKERTGSIAKVTAKDIENQPVNNVLSAVQGRMAGVSIIQNSGVTGGGYDIQIRGRNSLRNDGNHPLIIVDGISLNANSNTITALSTAALPRGISPLNAINPNDIESFTVLKDADATAIYGSRGANGVILITTKQSKTQKTSFSFSGSTSVSQVTKLLKLADTQQYLKLRSDAFALDGIVNYPANAYDINGQWSQDRYTDWYEKLIGKVYFNQQQQLNVQGGSEQNRFYLSIYNTTQSTPYLQDFRYKKYGFNLSSVFTSKDRRLKIAPVIYFTKQENHLAEIDITNQILLAPNAPDLYKADKSLNWENNTYMNPIAAFENKYSNAITSLSTQMTTEYNFTEYLQLKLNTGYTQTQQREYRTNPSTAYNPSFGYNSSISTIYTGTVPRENWIIEPSLNWQYEKGNHRIQALIGATLEQKDEATLQIMGKDFSSNELLYNLANAKIQRVTEDSEVKYRYIATYIRFNYRYVDRYFLNLTARRDGSSRFGPDKRFANFGAIGAAWLFSNEALLKDSNLLSFGKLRGSFGLTGSDQIGDYQYLNTYAISNLAYDGYTGLSPSRLLNPNFSWEKTQKLEAAVDLGFFKDRFNLSLAWYRNRSSNQLIGLTLPATTGFLSVQSNFPASVQSSGIEAELSVNFFKKNNFSWNMSINYSAPKSKLLAFENLAASAYSNTYVLGESMNIKKVYEYTGVNVVSGVYTFKDINGDGKIDAGDRTKVVDFGVKYFGGMNHEIRYKNLSMSFLWQFVIQRQYDLHYYMGISGIAQNVPTYMLDYWTPNNTSANYQRPTTGVNSDVLKAYSLYQNSDAVITDASFLRLNNIQLNYKVPRLLLSAMELSLGLQAQNLITLTRYKGLDPQMPGLVTPTTKTWSFIVQIKF